MVALLAIFSVRSFQVEVPTTESGLGPGNGDIFAGPPPVNTRVFGGPGQFPPEGFLAYGIVAFPSRAGADEADGDRARNMMICDAYLNTIPHYSEVEKRTAPTIATVWPTIDGKSADAANRASRKETCQIAVDNYGIARADAAISAARDTGLAVPNDRGPFLLAWSPGADFGNPQARILFVDMSYVEIEAQAKDLFAEWVERIEKSPDVWNQIPVAQQIRIRIRNPADRYGSWILDSLFATMQKISGGGPS